MNDETIDGVLCRQITDKRSRYFGRYEVLDIEVIKVCSLYEHSLKNREKLSKIHTERGKKTRAANDKKDKTLAGRRLKRSNPKEYRRRCEQLRQHLAERWKGHVRKTPEAKPKLSKKERAEVRREVTQKYWDAKKASENAEEIVNQMLADLFD